ncbi:asparagine synthase-related protein [Luteitalea sp.]
MNRPGSSHAFSAAITWDNRSVARTFSTATTDCSFLPAYARSGELTCAAWYSRSLAPVFRDGTHSPALWDSSVLLRALEQCEEAFAVAHWNVSERTLILGRDGLGLCSLYYIEQPEGVIFSTDFPALTEHSARSVSRTALASYVCSLEDHSATVYTDIKKVAPGQILTCHPRWSRSRPFWSPKDIAEDTSLSERESSERLHAAVVQRVRTMSQDSTLFELSGGWDSSCLVAVAATARPSCRLRTVSYTYGDSPTSDESYFIDPVERMHGTQSLHLTERDWQPLRGIEATARQTSYPTPYLCQAGLFNSLSRYCESEGVTSVVSGQGGDQLFLSNDIRLPLGHLIRSSSPLAVFSSALSWARHSKRSALSLLFEHSSTAADVAPPWFGPYVRDYLSERRASWLEHSRLVGVIAARRHQLVDEACRFVSSGYAAEISPSVQFVYPYLDKTVCESVLRTPVTHLVSPGEWRLMQRRTWGHLLPAEVVERTGKRGAGEAIMRAITKNYADLQSWFEEPLAAAYGVIDRSAFLGALARIRHGKPEWVGPTVWTIALEAWLRAHQGALSQSS